MRASLRLLLTVTALVETATGLSLVVWPGAVFVVLLGLEDAAAETHLVGRIAGAAILGIGVASWLVRSDLADTPQMGVAAGIGIYTVAAAALLTYAGTTLAMGGIGLWPAVVFHGLLGVWVLICLGRTKGFASGPSAT